MKNLLTALLFVGLAMSQMMLHASAVPAGQDARKPTKGHTASDVSRYVAQQGWTLAKSSFPMLPARDIAALFYAAEGDSAPGCGLLVRTVAGTEFFEMLRPEKGAGFPQCLAINDVATFDLHDRRYLVFEYISRDTTEDFYREYFYLYRDPAGRYIAASELNDSAVWTEPLPASRDRLDAPRAQEGIKRAKGTLLAKAVPRMQFLQREFMADKNRAFAAFYDKSNDKCAFVADAGAKPVTYEHDLFARGEKCKSVLASGKMERGGTTYFLALFAGASRNHLAVVSVAPTNVIAAETNLAIAVGKKSTLVDLKTAKEALKAAL